MFFDSRRSTVHGNNGMIATSQPLAAIAGLKVLFDGGNAIDACVAAAAVLNVVEPESTGIGGDMFALIRMADTKKVVSLNGSGRSGSGASIEELKSKGLSKLPDIGPYSVSVPGTVHGWETIMNEYGNMSLSDVLKPAIDYAINGFAVSDIISYQWKGQKDKLAQYPSGNEFLFGGKGPNEGDFVKLPTLGKTLQAIAEGGSEAFYTGEIAKKISDYVQQLGGWVTESDLNNHHSDWDEAISTDYRGVTCWECPPAGQGIVALEAMNIVEEFDIAGMGAQSVEAYHHMIEAIRLSFADAGQYVADPRVSDVPTDVLISKAYASTRRGLIDPKKAMGDVPYGDVMKDGDTVYISCVDKDGNACSFINSIFTNFGSGLVVPDTGIVLQNRGSLFELDENHLNALEPNKRPFHTIIPAMATKDSELWLSFGVMGGFQQPQEHLQVISNMVDYNMDPQQALDALRFNVDITDTNDINLEEGLDINIVNELIKRGHKVNILSGSDRMAMGGGQIICRDPETGIIFAGSEPRKDGAAVGW